MPRLTAKQSQHARQIARLERAEPVIENLQNIPNRDTLDAHGRLSEGLDRRKLKSQSLTEAEMATNAVNNRTLAPAAVLNANIGEQINAGKLPNIGGLSGDLPADKLPNVPVAKLPAGTIVGNVQRGNIANNAVHAKDQIDWNVGGGGFVPIGALSSQPWPTQQNVDAKTNAKDVNALIKKHVTPSAYR